MEESNNSGVVDFPENFMDELLWEECWDEENEVASSSGLKERVTCAMRHLQEVMGERELLIQLWVPVERRSGRVLSTEDQPYSLNPFSQSQSLALYRDASAGYSFAAEVGSDQLVGLPGRVFLRRMPEWTPDVRFLSSEEYPRIGYARRYQVRASLALPLFQGASGNCVAVMEMVTTRRSLEYASQIHTICHALEAFDLRTSQTSSIIPAASLKPHTVDLHTEVASILQGICSWHGLPLAITWGHQDSSTLSALISACYASNQDSRCFLAACSEHHLLGGQGIAGRAFATKKQCFETDVAIFSKWSYPLSHYAKMLDLHAALAVPLLTRRNRTVQFVLEFFFPRDCLDIQTQRLTLVSQLNQRFQSSPHLMVDDQLAEDVRDTATPLTDHSSRSAQEEATDPKGKSLSFYSSSSMESRKRKTRAENDITLETLKQHFAGSLKDAAKNIGVCPTTLKRICRQHGISRWPSRKIKKVGHSLRKLQVVMDSVEGVQGSLHLASFYSSFPQLQSSSFPLINPTQTVHVPPKSPPSLSGSQSSSGSSTCCSSEEQQLGGFQKPALSHPQLLTLSSLQEDQRPARVTSSLPPLPSATASRKAKDGMKVKAMFRDSMLRMCLQPHSRLTDLRREIAKRFGMDDVLTSNFSLKYMDDDQEWVLLTCDADLEECIQVYKSSLEKTIRILVHHPLSRPSFES
ncbi:PREDICTED: protein NLP3-like [Camelina sativa]|uniref:Protein NLP3-like n=1 Tax=Camelina sativa TaxID=90675 RepID=A0ABM0TUQ3_CAMSA|nr:PREDICTED: protein NLP3-like [Camelina sativa]